MHSAPLSGGDYVLLALDIFESFRHAIFGAPFEDLNIPPRENPELFFCIFFIFILS